MPNTYTQVYLHIVFGLLTVAIMLLAVFNDKGALEVHSQAQKLTTIETDVAKLDADWLVVIEYADIGYVADNDADKLDVGHAGEDARVFLPQVADPDDCQAQSLHQLLSPVRS